MKQMLLIFFVMIFCLAVPAQKKVTDREIEGLKGAVKTVFGDYMVTYSTSDQTELNKRVKETEHYFDKDGALTRILFPFSNYKQVYSLIDGFKTFKGSSIKENAEPENQYNVGKSIDGKKEKPDEKNGKLVPPDERFDLKIVYEYDANGKVETEKTYRNNGKFWGSITYKYDKNGRVREDLRKETNATIRFTYKYNDEGYLIETLGIYEFNIRVTTNERTVYSDYKVDPQGNWTQRKAMWTSKTQDRFYASTKINYRTIEYY